MKLVPLNHETAAVARRVVWFEPPTKSLSDPIRLMAYAMAHATHEQMKILRRYVSDDDFREALDHAPPGIIDPRSWAYWNSKMARYPPPPLPVRRFGNYDGPARLDFQQSKESGSRSPARKLSLEQERRNARTAWQEMRQQDLSPMTLEEIRRRAREE